MLSMCAAHLYGYLCLPVQLGFWAQPDTISAAAPTPWSYLLPAAATGLQVPRAAFSRVGMWRLGTSWATGGAALQAAVVAAALGSVGGSVAAVMLCVLWLGGIQALNLICWQIIPTTVATEKQD